MLMQGVKVWGKKQGVCREQRAAFAWEREVERLLSPLSSPTNRQPPLSLPV